MKILLTGNAQKAYNKINEPDKTRLNRAMYKLAKNPPDGDIVKLEGRDGYRGRFGGWRIMFDIDYNYIDPETNEKGAVTVFDIATRGGVYKGA